MKIYYTFRTNKDITRIKESGKPLFVFGNLKQDLQKFFNLLSEYIQNNKLLIKHSFIHYNKADIELVLGTPNKPTPPLQPSPLQQAHT